MLQDTLHHFHVSAVMAESESVGIHFLRIEDMDYLLEELSQNLTLLDTGPILKPKGDKIRGLYIQDCQSPTSRSLWCCREG